MSEQPSEITKLKLEIRQKKRRLVYLRGILHMLQRKSERIQQDIEQHGPQVSALECIVRTMRELPGETLVALFRKRQRLRREVAAIRRKREASEDDDLKLKRVNSGFYLAHECELKCDCPITREPIPLGKGIMAHGTFYNASSLKTLFETQFTAAVHLHDPISRAVKPSEFPVLHALGLISKETANALIQRYPADKFVPNPDPYRRFQLQRMASHLSL